jgi:hypothetical protein
VRSLGIEVRAGLRTGECEIRGDDIGGIAVHIGARVSALEGPNDSSPSPLGKCTDRRSEGRWVAVAVAVARWGWSEVARAADPAAGAGNVVSASLGADALGAILGAGAAAPGHHRSALAAVFGRRIGLGW